MTDPKPAFPAFFEIPLAQPPLSPDCSPGSRLHHPPLLSLSVGTKAVSDVCSEAFRLGVLDLSGAQQSRLESTPRPFSLSSQEPNTAGN